MFKSEWKQIFQNKMTLIIILGVSLIPMLYTTFFLGSMWDPYGKAEDLPVAIVNLDHPVVYQGQTLNIGENMVDQLKEEKPLKCSFVTQEEADEGLEDGNYYMVVTIPEDFSENAATLLDEKPQKMNLIYKTNPGRNFFASKITDSAVKSMKESVSKEVTKTYAKAVFSSIGEVGDSLSTAVDGAGDLYDGATTVANGNEKILENLSTLSESTLTFKDGASELTTGLSDYLSGVASLKDGASSLDQGMDQMASSVAPLEDGVGELNNGASQLNDGIQQYTSGVAQVKEGGETLSSKGGELISGISSFSNELTSGLDQLKSGNDQLLQGLNQMNDQIPDTDSLNALNEGLNTIANSMEALNSSLQNQSISMDNQKIKEDLTSIQTNLQGLSNSLSNISTNTNADDSEVVARIQESSVFYELDSEQQAQLLSDVQRGSSMEQGNTLSSDSMVYIQKIATATEDLGNQMASLDSLSANVASLKTNMASLTGQGKEALTSAQGAVTGLKNVKQSLTAENGFIAGVSTVDQGLDSLKSGITNGSEQLTDGAKTYTEGVYRLNTAIEVLDGNSETLNLGAGQLSTGIHQMSDQMPALKAGVSSLTDGSGQLLSGVTELQNHSGDLNNGMTTLEEGAKKLSDGSVQLEDGSGKIQEGMTALQDGSNELYTNLRDGVDEIKDQKTGEQTYDMVAEPTQIESEEITHVQNNGIAMAPYMFSVSLYVGAIAFCVMYPIEKASKKTKNGVKWWFSKASVFFVCALLQSGIMMAILMMVNGLEPMEAFKTFATCVLVSMTFMTLISTLNLWFGPVGKFLSMLILILQLAGSAGTYPIELSGGFYEKIHPYLPATYSIDAFHHTLSMGGSIFYDVMILVVVMIVSSIFGILYFQKEVKRQKTEKFVKIA
ncbi:MAG TPA: YhgE/Pip domain-containing protein [Candidatus Merdenecus merdavium]|nr:YhgE/Pip domain-containing protein [Candidatus Merdenecus merdavium]